MPARLANEPKAEMFGVVTPFNHKQRTRNLKIRHVCSNGQFKVTNYKDMGSYIPFLQPDILLTELPVQ